MCWTYAHISIVWLLWQAWSDTPIVRHSQAACHIRSKAEKLQPQLLNACLSHTHIHTLTQRWHSLHLLLKETEYKEQNSNPVKNKQNKKKTSYSSLLLAGIHWHNYNGKRNRQILFALCSDIDSHGAVQNYTPPTQSELVMGMGRLGSHSHVSSIYKCAGVWLSITDQHCRCLFSWTWFTPVVCSWAAAGQVHLLCYLRFDQTQTPSAQWAEQTALRCHLIQRAKSICQDSFRIACRCFSVDLVPIDIAQAPFHKENFWHRQCGQNSSKKLIR